MIDTDELDPPRPVLKPLNMQEMSIGELKNYIAALREEIARAESMIKTKESHRTGIESLFRTS